MLLLNKVWRVFINVTLSIAILIFLFVFAKNYLFEGKTGGEEFGDLSQFIEIEKDYKFDTVAFGDTIKYSYVFKNISDKEIKITSVNATCGCTVADREWEAPVKPNEMGSITLIYYTGLSTKGYIHKTTQVYSNKGQTALTMAGFVKY